MKKVKWGVIGAGGIADRRTIPGMLLADNAELVAVMEINMGLAESLREKYNAKYAYDSFEELLKNDEIEAVYIASPVNCHKEQAIAAAKAKKHILIEKPVGLTVEEGNEILKVCRQEGVKIAAGFVMRFHTYHQKMKQLIAEGKLGDIVSCRAQLTCWYPEIAGAWRQVKKLSGGGCMMDMSIHCMDLIQYVVGSRAKKIASFNSTNTFKYEVEDQSSSIIELENGAFAYVDSNFNIPDAAAKCRFEIYGTRGSALCEGTIGQVEGGTINVVVTEAGGYDAQQNRNDVTPLKIDGEFGNMYTKEIESFGRSILDNTPIEAPAEDAVFVQSVIEAAYKSTEMGKIITL